MVSAQAGRQGPNYKFWLHDYFFVPRWKTGACGLRIRTNLEVYDITLPLLLIRETHHSRHS